MNGEVLIEAVLQADGMLTRDNDTPRRRGRACQANPEGKAYIARLTLPRISSTV